MGSEAMIAAPSPLYALSFGLSAWMISAANQPKGPAWKRALTDLMLVLFSMTFSHFTENLEDWFFFPNLFLVLAVNGFLFWVSCDMPLPKIIFFVFHSFIIGEFCMAFSWQIWLYLQSISILPDLPWIRNLVCSALVILPITLFWLYARRRREDFTRLKVDGRILCSTGLTALGIFLFSNISNFFRDTPFSGRTAFEINLIRMLVDAGGVILLEAWRSNWDEEQSRAEVKIMQELMKAQYNNYQTSERSMALIHQKYHDLKHQIAYLRQTTSDQQRQEYLDEMEKDIRSFEAGSCSGNHVMDTIVTDKMLQCQQLGIRLTSSGDGRLLGFLSPMDLSALLGNLLDNAIEHVSTIEDPSLRVIEMEVRAREQFIVLEVSNPVQGEIRFQGGLPKSTKGDEQYHGFGTKSIRMTVERYGGSVSFLMDHRWFIVKAVFMKN